MLNPTHSLPQSTDSTTRRTTSNKRNKKLYH